MDVPGIVEEALDGEEVAADVDLGGDDALFVTPTRVLLYRSEGLLSDESVESYSLEAESLSISEGRRKTRITLEHPIEGVEEFTLPSNAADQAIPSILAGILGMNDVLGEGENVVDTYLFSELTLVVSDDRLVKHVGETVWDLEFEVYPFDDVTAVYAEQGSVATQLIVEVDGRAERIKTPSDRAREVRETLEDAIRRHHGIAAEADLNDALAPAEPSEPEPESEPEADDNAGTGGMDFGEGVDPLSAGDTTQDGRNPDPRDLEQESQAEESRTQASQTAQETPAAAEDATDAETAPTTTGNQAQSEARDAQSSEDRSTADAARSEPAGGSAAAGAAAESDDASDDGGKTSDTSENAPTEPVPDEFQDAGFEPASDPSEELAEEVAELRSAVQKQNKLLARQHKTIQKLVEELRRGR